MSKETSCARLESAVQIVNDGLVISISAETLAHAARNSECFFQSAEDGTKLAITNAVDFMTSVAKCLNEESEDGSTPITRMFDRAIEQVVDDGEPGVDEV
jgi:formaldehyde-activating enzyme involved in methanogenesis